MYLAFPRLILCRIFLFTLTLCTSSFFKIGPIIFSILLQHHLQIFQRSSDLLSEVSKFQHHKKLCFKCRKNKILCFCDWRKRASLVNTYSLWTSDNVTYWPTPASKGKHLSDPSTYLSVWPAAWSPYGRCMICAFREMALWVGKLGSVLVYNYRTNLELPFDRVSVESALTPYRPTWKGMRSSRKIRKLEAPT
jgi:hypothetical protein